MRGTGRPRPAWDGADGASSGSEAGVLGYLQDQLIATGYLSTPIDTNRLASDDAAKLERCLNAMLARTAVRAISDSSALTMADAVQLRTIRPPRHQPDGQVPRPGERVCEGRNAGEQRQAGSRGERARARVGPRREQRM